MNTYKSLVERLSKAIKNAVDNDDGVCEIMYDLAVFGYEAKLELFVNLTSSICHEKKKRYIN